MDLNFNLHNMFVSNEMEEFNHLPNMPGGKYQVPYKDIADKEGILYYNYDKEKPEDLDLLDHVRHEFVRRVDQHMQHYQGEKINSLRVYFLLGSGHNEVIDQWVSRAIAKGAERIELLFSHRAYGMPRNLPYRFPYALCSDSISHLQLRNCQLLPQAEFSGFKQLKTLVLEELVVEDDLLLCLSSKCLLLEDLSFINCQFSHTIKMISRNISITNFQINDTINMTDANLSFIDCEFYYTINIISPTLRHLKIIHCDIPYELKMNIVASNLSSLEYGGADIMDLTSINAPQLTKFYFNLSCHSSYLENSGVPHAFDLLASLHQLWSLNMVLSQSQVARFPPTIPPFQHLKEMDLIFYGAQDGNGDYLGVLNLVMACPRLQKLCLGIGCPCHVGNQRPRREHPRFSHNELKYVELHGCAGQTIEIELAIHFLKNVNSLEHITFGPRSRAYLGDGRWLDGYGSPHWFETGHNLIREQLQHHVNGRTQLIFL